MKSTRNNQQESKITVANFHLLKHAYRPCDDLFLAALIFSIAWYA